MRLPIVQPDKEILSKALENVIQGEVSRTEFQSWIKEIDEAFPTEFHKDPLLMEDSFHIWYTIQNINEKKCKYWLQDNEDYIFRDSDIKFLIEHLNNVNCSESDGPFRKVYWNEIPESDAKIYDSLCELYFESGENKFLNLKFPFYRMVLDSFYDLKEVREYSAQ